MSALAVGERDRLAVCEGVIDRGLATFVQVGEALVEIRESRLYRDGHPTFEAYCRQRWGFSRKRAYDLTAAAEAVGALSPMGDIPLPRSERAARELVPLRSDRDRLREPVFAAANGDDPLALVVSLNVKRRNLNAGQRAVAAAEAWELASPNLGRGKGRAQTLGDLFGVAHGYVTQARALLRDVPELAARVKAGEVALSAAYDALTSREDRERATREAAERQLSATPRRVK